MSLNKRSFDNLTPAKRASCGFSLVEVLIAIVVLSVGLLGLAGLQATGLRNNHSAYLRSIATLQAYDMADRMRANIQGVQAGAYDSISGTPTAPDCSVSCAPSVIATLDNSQWNTSNASLLPSGTGTVTGAGLGSIFTITVTWTDVGGQPATFVVTAQPS
jgi:type IV pilus assembly protein PilV